MYMIQWVIAMTPASAKGIKCIYAYEVVCHALLNTKILPTNIVSAVFKISCVRALLDRSRSKLRNTLPIGLALLASCTSTQFSTLDYLSSIRIISRGAGGACTLEKVVAPDSYM